LRYVRQLSGSTLPHNQRIALFASGVLLAGGSRYFPRVMSSSNNWFNVYGINSSRDADDTF
jgi:hypothetical protein